MEIKHRRVVGVRSSIFVRVFEFAVGEACNFKHDYVGTEHLLFSLLREQDGVAAQVLMNLNLRLEDVRATVLNILDEERETEKTVEKSLVRIAGALEALAESARNPSSRSP